MSAISGHELANWVKNIEAMRGLMWRYKNKDNCLLALSPQFHSGIVCFMNSASSV